jgi:RNA 2',3'-cyclic 3'-phosphodiesterase
MRVFAALVPPPDVLDHLADFLSPRLDDAAAQALGWTRRENWHLTLAFMGTARADAVDSFVERLAEGALDLPRPALSICGGGAFPGVERARVLYAGLTGDTGLLRRLSDRTRSAAAVSGCGPDGRAFVPHLTLARSRRPVEATRWVRVLDTYAGPSWTPTAVSVIESVLGHGRPRYATLAEVPVGPVSYTD